MKSKTKERVAFMAGSLIKLTDITTIDLKDVSNIVGIDVIQKYFDPDPLYDLLDFDTMAERICLSIGREPIWPVYGRADKELTRMGRQIADLVEDASPVDEEASENLLAVLTWCGLGAWLAANNGQEVRMQ